MELLLDAGRQRYYKLDFVVEKGVNGKIGNPTDLIVVSDAHTHVERMVFAFTMGEGFNLDDLKANTQCIHVDYMEVAGDMTMMIHGGDSSTIREPEEYIEELRALNKK